jgi:hypothetical protein
MDQISGEKDSRGAKTVAEKVGMIKNPLTIIAIFAGIAELSGTIVLPLLKDNIQFIFVWFVMFFPVGLVVLFFFVLIFRNNVLYAPSDYKNEENFVMLQRPSISPANPKEIEDKLIAEFETAEEAEQNQVPLPREETKAGDLSLIPASPTEAREILRGDSMVSRDSSALSRRRAIESIRSNASEVERIILSRIRFNQNVDLDEEVSLKFENGNKIVADGAYYQNDRLTVIEVKRYSRKSGYSNIKGFLKRIADFSGNKPSNLNIRIILFSDKKETGVPDLDMLRQESFFLNVPVTFEYIDIDELIS